MSRVLITILVLLSERGSYRTFSAGELTPDLFGRIDVPGVHAGSRVVENMFTWPHGPIEKRPGTEFVAPIAVTRVIPGTPGTPGTDSTYNFTIISENGKVWYLPVGDGEMLGSLDAGESAVNRGGGVVGLPWTNHPFTAGEVVRITNTTNYNDAFTLQAGTTADELQITDTYNAEVFDGSEVIAKIISGLQSGGGDMVQDDDGNLYYAHIWRAAQSTYVTKIAPDGTLTYNDFTGGGWPINGDTGSETRDVKITNDGLYLYLMLNDPGPTPRIHVQKYLISTGVLEWTVIAGTFGGFDMDVDDANNVYVGGVSSIGGFSGTVAFDANDGSVLLDYGDNADHNYVVVVNSTLNLLLTSFNKTVYFNNLANTANDTLSLAANLGTDGVVIVGEFIYLIERNGSTIHKLTWDGSSVSTVDTAPGPAFGEGIYIDLYGNIVIVNQRWTPGRTDVLWVYDKDLNFIATLDGFYPALLANWNPPAGGAWFQGNVYFDGRIAIAGTPDIPDTEVDIVFEDVDIRPPARLIPFIGSIRDPLVLEIGHKYMRFFKDEP